MMHYPLKKHYETMKRIPEEFSKDVYELISAFYKFMETDEDDYMEAPIGIDQEEWENDCLACYLYYAGYNEGRETERQLQRELEGIETSETE